MNIITIMNMSMLSITITITANLSDILEIIQNSGISQQAKKTASAVFYKLAQAEAHVHGEPIEKVHFHEVGALDSIIDIIGAAIGLDYLGIERIYASPLPFSGGQVKTDHGLMPVPAPATLQILKEAHAPFRPVPGDGEMITPTGAAILAALATFEKPAFSITSVGIGAGYKEFEWPNILRVMIGSQENSEKT